MENEEEIWKDIPNYEGYYQVSNLGRVKSSRKTKYFKEKILIGGKSKGYNTVTFRVNKSIKTFTVHKLVAITFLNHKPDGTTKFVVDHINNNCLDNRLDNLQILTHRENTSKGFRRKKDLPIGVRKMYSVYDSRITIEKKTKFLGYFKTPEEASKAYQNELKKLIHDNTSREN